MTELTSRQVRALILLLILVPLIPTTLLLRLMHVTIQSEESAAQDRERDLYLQALHAAGIALKAHLATANFSPSEKPSRVLEYFQRAFAKDTVVRLLDRDGQTIAGAPPSSRPPLAETTLGPELGGWRVQLLPADASTPPDDFVAQILSDPLERSIAIAIIANLTIAGLGGYALNRQIRLQEIKSSTIDTMAHELKTPLASVRVLLDTLLTHPCPPEQTRDYLELISNENLRLSRITENFLTIARLERGLFKITQTPAPPDEIIAAALEAVRLRTESAGSQIAVHTEPDLPEIAVDREAMTTALVNLIDNALKYSGESKQITVSARALKHRVIMEVTDNGIGIPRREQKKIFERFYQADQRLSRRHEGCGLGLSIVKSIVEAHHGTVRVQSREGSGSTFSIELPAAQANLLAPLPA